MNKDYDFLNDIVVDFSQYEDIKLNDIEKKNIQKRIKGKLKLKRKNKKVAIITAASLMLVGLLVFNGVVVEATILDITNKIGDFFARDNNSYSNFTKGIGQTVVDKGVKITLNEALITNDKAILSLTVDIRDFKNISNIRLYPEIYINGEKVNDGISSSEYLDKEDGVYETIQDISINNKAQNDYTVEIKYTEGEYKWLGIERALKGNWDFTCNYNSDNILSNTKSINLNRKVDLGDGNVFELGTLQISPIYSKLRYKVISQNNNLEIENQNTINFTLMDSNKNFVTTDGTSILGDLQSNEFISTEFIKGNLTDKIYIVPYVREISKGNEKENYEDNFKYYWDNAIEVNLN